MISKSPESAVKTPSLVIWGFFFGTLFLLIAGKSFFSSLDTRLRDFWYRVRIDAGNPSEHPIIGKLAPILPPVKNVENIILVIADDRSVLGIPALFQGDRRVYAQVLKQIGAGKPRAIGLDVFFPNITAHDEEQDKILADTVKELGNVVLKSFRRGDQQMTPPYPALAVAGNSAPSYFRPHVDEAVRKVSLVFRPASGEPMPSFQTEIARMYFGIQREHLDFEAEQISLHLPSGDFRIPLTDGENIFVNYSLAPRSFRSIPMIDVYTGNEDSSVFKEKIVLLGVANSMSEDRNFTPLGGPEFTTFIHAVILQNLISREIVSAGSAWEGDIMGLLFLISSVFVASRFLHPGAFAIGTILGSILLLGGSGFLLLFSNRVIDVTPSLFALIGTFIFSTGQKYYSELSEKLRIKNAFQHYVTASVVNEILKDPTKLNLHGEERNLTIFFSDIEGFTTISEGMSPLVVVSLLNEYLTTMTEIIFKFDGLLDKYEGDAIMSVFGAPIDQSDHAIRACRCALEHQKVLAKMRETWKKEGKPGLRIRIGINTGIVVVGNMGSKMRFDYTVIGDNVNLAARLETANKLFNTDILISGATAELAKTAILTRFLGMLKVMGRKQAVPVYEVLAALNDPDTAAIESQHLAKQVYEKALSLALQQKFSEAILELVPFCEKYHDDRPALLLKKRCEDFILKPPPPDWDGIMVQEQK